LEDISGTVKIDLSNTISFITVFNYYLNIFGFALKIFISKYMEMSYMDSGNIF